MRRYKPSSTLELKQLTSTEVVERLVESAKRLRDARRRHERPVSAARKPFYDALAGGVRSEGRPSACEDRA